MKKKTKVDYFYLVCQFPLLTFFHYLTGFLSAYGMAKILTQVTKYVNNKDKSVNIEQIRGSFWEIIGRFLLTYGIIVLLHIAMEIWLVEVYSSHLRQKLTQKYLKAEFTQTQKASFILTNYESEAINVGSKAAQLFNRCFYAVVSIFFIFWELDKKEEQRWLIPWLFGALLILSLIGLLLYRLAYLPRFRRTRAIQKENKHFEELKTNLEYIKITGTETKEIEKNDDLVRQNLKKTFPLVAGKTLFATIPNYLLVKILPIPFLLVADAAGTTELFVLYFQLDVLFGGWKKFFEELWAKGGYDGYRSSLQQLNNGFAILEKNSYPVPKDSSLFPAKPNIVFQEVDFTYPKTDQKLLDKFSFTFVNDKKYMIIGSNGIGKSTLFKLIVKLYRPQSGIIKVNQVELEKIDNSARQKKIIYLPNNPFFFNTSLGNNIFYPDTYQANIHQESLEKVAKELGIKEFIDQLPNRWETTIAEKGQNLSEGQKQIVSLMRIFARDYEIYLLDEFLSSVSDDLKKAILPVIFHKLSNKTVIFISHDKEIQKYADETYQFTPSKLIPKNTEKNN